MILRVLTRLLRVAPPGWALVAFLVFYILCEGPVWYLERKLGRLDMPNRFGPRILRIASFLLGAYRVIAFHPYFRPRYLRWLKGTPWTVSKPLPLGPLELVPEDSLALAVLALLGATLPDFTALYIINIFLFAHIIVMILTFWKTGALVYGYCALLFLGFIPQFWRWQWVDFAILTGIYLLVHEGLWHTLRKFPWQTEGFLRDFGLVNDPAVTSANPPCGWSFDRFYRDIRMATGVNRIDAVIGCMLGSWWLFSMLSLIPDSRERGMASAVIVIPTIFASAGARFLIYARGCRAPISLWGRIWTFRAIIPRFDQIFVGPICSLLGGFLVLSFLRYRLVPVDVCFSAAGGVAVLLALISPPTLKRFRLVGQHRLAPTLSDAQQAVNASGSRS